jgi:nucleotide-binding universal stress UspA family protein
MQSILVPIDGSKPCDAVVRHAIREVRTGQVAHIHLVNVQPHLGAYVGRFVGTPTIRAFQRELGEKALARAKQLLDEAAVPYTAHIYVGEAAAAIAAAAASLGVGEIVMSASGFGIPGSLAGNSLIGSVIRRSDVPVSVIKAASDLDFENSTGQWKLRPTH